MTLLLSTSTPSPTRRFTHPATSTDPSVSTVLIMWDPLLKSLVAELYETPTTLEREAAFLVLGDEPLRPIHSLAELEDQLGDRVQPLSQTLRESITLEVLADLFSRLKWLFIPGNRHTFSTIAHLSPLALKVCCLNTFCPDEWGRLKQNVACFQSYKITGFEEDTEVPFAVCPLTQQTFTPTRQYRFVLGL